MLMGFDSNGVRGSPATGVIFGLPATGAIFSFATFEAAAAVNNTSRPLSSNPKYSMEAVENIWFKVQNTFITYGYNEKLFILPTTVSFGGKKEGLSVVVD